MNVGMGILLCLLLFLFLFFLVLIFLLVCIRILQNKQLSHAVNELIYYNYLSIYNIKYVYFGLCIQEVKAHLIGIIFASYQRRFLLERMETITESYKWSKHRD